jgi:hypothetical protein
LLTTFKDSFSWLENLLINTLDWFYSLDVIFQYGIIITLIYIFTLGMIEFIKKVLIYIPRKIIGIIVVVIVLYILVAYFKA